MNSKRGPRGYILGGFLKLRETDDFLLRQVTFAILSRTRDDVLEARDRLLDGGECASRDVCRVCLEREEEVFNLQWIVRPQEWVFQVSFEIANPCGVDACAFFSHRWTREECVRMSFRQTFTALCSQSLEEGIRRVDEHPFHLFSLQKLVTSRVIQRMDSLL